MLNGLKNGKVLIAKLWLSYSLICISEDGSVTEILKQSHVILDFFNAQLKISYRCRKNNKNQLKFLIQKVLLWQSLCFLSCPKIVFSGSGKTKKSVEFNVIFQTWKVKKFDYRSQKVWEQWREKCIYWTAIFTFFFTPVSSSLGLKTLFRSWGGQGYRELFWILQVWNCLNSEISPFSDHLGKSAYAWSPEVR